MPRVGDDSGTQILPGFCKDSEHQTVYAYDDRGPRTLINVARAKQRRREKHADRSAAGPSDKLPLQVAAKNGFFADAGGDGESDPQSDSNGPCGASRRAARLIPWEPTV